MTGRAVVGMAGWVYAPWRGTFYPRGLPQKSELAYASANVTSIELNAPFYALPAPSSWRSWAEATPPDFVFAVKAPKRITQIKRLSNVAEDLSNFFASGILALGPKLGVILWQLDANLRFDFEVLERFLAALPQTTGEALQLAQARGDRMSGREYLETDDPARPVRHALEVRNHSFDTPVLVELLAKYRVALVLGDTGGMWPVLDETTTDFRYARLHADVALYPDGYYENADIDRWGSRIESWIDAGQDAYIYFVNDTKVRSPIDAMSLIDRLSA